MKLGIHFGTSGATALCHQTADALGASVLLFFSPHQVSDAEKYRDATIIYRTANPHPDETPDAWLARATGAIDPWVQHYGASGQLLLQHSTEPEVGGYDLPTPWNLDAWLAAAHGYRDALMARYPGVPLLAPPLSVGNTPRLTADYLSGYAAAAVHCYFSVGNPGWRQGRDGGAAWRCATDLGTPVYVSEVNSNPTSVDEIVAWAREVDSPLVLGATLFIADSAASWPQYTIAPDHAAAIRTALATPAPSPPPPTPPEAPVTVDDVWRAVCAATSNPRVRIAMMMGGALESSLQAVVQQGGGPGRGVWQVEAAEGGSHFGAISEADAMNPTTAAQFMLADYEAGVRDISDADYASDPAQAYAQAAFRSERPAQMYPEDRIARAWQMVQPYVSATPPGTPTTDGVYGEDLIAKLSTQIGHERSGTFDTVNGDHPWAYYCLAGVQSAAIACGLTYALRPSAIAKYQAAFDQGLIQTGIPEHGAQVFFGTAFYAPDGHTALWNTDKQQVLGTLTDGTGVGYRNWGPGTNGYLGWMRIPGVMGPRRALPVPPPDPPMDANTNYVPVGNPFNSDAAHPVGVGGANKREYVKAPEVFGWPVVNEFDALVFDSKVSGPYTLQMYENLTTCYDKATDTLTILKPGIRILPK